jgi:putative transposase
MARKSYSEELAASGGGPVRDDTEGDGAWDRQDPGIVCGTLRQWLARYGTGRKTGADGRPAPSPLRPREAGGSRTGGETKEGPSEVDARQEAANAELRAQTVKLTRGACGNLLAGGQASLAGGDNPVGPVPLYFLGRL